MKKSLKALVAIAGVGSVAAVCAAGSHLARVALDPNYKGTTTVRKLEKRLVPSTGDESGQALEWCADWPHKRPVYISSRDGLTLHGRLFLPVAPGKNTSHRWAVCLHGYATVGPVTAAFARHYVERGWNALLPDLRAHGESEGNSRGMGWLDRLDLLDWIDDILRRDPDAEIILHGVSMGASAALMTSGEVLPPNVKAIISDSAYTSAWQEFRDTLHAAHLPAFPLLPAAAIAAHKWAGYWIQEADAVKQVRASVTPTLFIHGLDDTCVKPDMVLTLCDACAAPKEWLLVPGCTHGNAVFQNPDLYWPRVDGFLAKHMEKKDED